MSENENFTEHVCPRCKGTGKIKVRDECKVKGCKEPSEYHYSNPISKTSGEYCKKHMNELRPEMWADEWVGIGFAQKLT